MIPNPEYIKDAHERIKSMIHRTPVMHSQQLDQISGASIFFKCENLQRCGAFKMRGASHAVSRLTEAELNKGVATHSSGNHAQALALAAKTKGIPAYIVMPKNAPSVKVAGVKGYGAEIVFCEPTLAARESTLEKVVKRTGATFIHPFNNYDVIAGQATAALEMLEEVPDLDFILAPVGGGGLLSGTALTASYHFKNLKVIGCEPEGAKDAYESFHSGEIIPSIAPNTISDGLLTSLGEKTYGIIKEYVHDILLANDEETIEAMKLVWERMKLVIEPSAAVPFAVLLKNREQFKEQKVGIIISGGNLDLSNLPF